MNETITIQEAAEQIKRIVPSAMTAQRTYMECIWKWGEIVAKVDKPWGRRVEIYEELNSLTGIHFNLLRQYEALYNQFLGKHESFTRFLNYYEKTNKLRVNFSNIFNVLKLFDKIEPDFQKDILARQVEAAVAKVADMNEKAKEGRIEKNTSESLTSALDIEYIELRENLEELEETVFADRTPKSEAHLEWVRSHRCILSATCDCQFKDDTTHAHHTQVGGRGIKGSDFSAIPLCPRSHQYYHDHGEPDFEKKYDVKSAELVAEMLHRRMTNQPLFWFFDLSK